MSKRSVFTTVTALPPGITRETVMDTLRSHTEMIDLNPLVEERHPIKPPANASAEEFHCQWYSLTDRVQYLPGGMMSGKVSYNACFHDLEAGVQTHVRAPLGLDIKGKWTLGGSLPGEPVAPIELGLGAPLTGLWLREDVDMRCNFMMTSFVKSTLKKSHATLVSRLLVKAQIVEASLENQKLGEIAYNPSGRLDHPVSKPQPYNNIQNTTSYASDSQSDLHEDSSLRPQPLSIRSSSSTFASSTSAGSQHGRPTYQDPSTKAKVSWQNLNQGNRDPLRQNNMYRTSPPQGSSNPVEYQPSHQRQDSWQQQQQQKWQMEQQSRGAPTSPLPPLPPPKNQPNQMYELE